MIPPKQLGRSEAINSTSLATYPIAGWSTFTEMVKAKAASAGRTVVFVNPFQTSQVCSGCGTVVKKDLSERWHSCECGCELDRDTNAAINILHAAYQLLSVGTR